MRRKRVTFVLLCLAFLSWASSADAGVRFSAVEIDGGTVKRGQTFEREFVLRNGSSQPVEILAVRTSCGCLVPTATTGPIFPGSEGRVRVAVNTLTQAAGAHAWTATVSVRSGDGVAEQTLTLRATVVAEITVEPTALVIYADRPLRRVIKIQDSRQKPLTISRLAATAPFLRCQVLQAGASSAGGAEVAVEVLQTCPPGRHEETVSLFTDDPDYPELRVPTTIVMRTPGHVTASPESLRLRGGSGATVLSGLVRLRAGGDEAVVLREAKCDHPAVTCRWASGPGAGATLKVSVDRSRTEGGRIEATVRLVFTVPGGLELQLPISCQFE